MSFRTLCADAETPLLAFLSFIHLFLIGSTFLHVNVLRATLVRFPIIYTPKERKELELKMGKLRLRNILGRLHGRERS